MKHHVTLTVVSTKSKNLESLLKPKTTKLVLTDNTNEEPEHGFSIVQGT